MFQFAQPIWLYAISGIVFPIAIHLWNVKQGKTLRVGSIALVEQSSRQTSRNLNLTELLLLILRCMLIIFLALLLAKPSWRSSNSVSAKKWLLIDKNSTQQAYKQHQKLIDSLTQEGCEFHYFNNGLAKEKFSVALKESQDTNAVGDVNYWVLLDDLDSKLPNDGSAYIIAPALLKDFPGKRPTLSHEIHWLTLNEVNIDSMKLVEAWRSSNDSIHIIAGRSKDSSLTYEHITTAAGASLQNGINILKQGNDIKVTSNEQQLVADTSSVIVTIFADRNSSDANYISAALKAIQSFSQRNIKIEVSSDANALPASQQWLFWLSEKSIPSIKKFTNLFRYVAGKQQTLQSWIEGGNYAVTGEIPLRKRVMFDPSDNQFVPIWKDGYGIPLLTEGKSNNSNVYNFYSRFNTSWNDLGWSSYFPSLMMELILKKDIIDARDNTTDRRVIDPVLLQFTAAKNNRQINNAAAVSDDLFAGAWIVVYMLFLLERWVSLRTKKRVAEK